jgi:excisionase family DNA binding protein
VPEVVERMGVSRSVVYDLIAKGELPAWQPGGHNHTIRVDEAEFEARLDSPLVFPAAMGGHIGLDTWRARIWTPALEAAGIAQRGPYQPAAHLRHGGPGGGRDYLRVVAGDGYEPPND